MEEIFKNILVKDRKFNNAHLLDEKNKGLFQSPTALSVTFKDTKKSDVQNPVVGNILSLVSANQLNDDQVKNLLGEGEDLKIRARLDALRNNKSDDENDDNDGSYPQPPSSPPLPPIALLSFLTPPTPPASLRSAKKKKERPPPDDYAMDISDNEEDQIDFVLKTDPVFETDFNRPTMLLIDKTNNVTEMIPKVKENPKQETIDLNLSEQLAKLFPDVGKKYKLKWYIRNTRATN